MYIHILEDNISMALDIELILNDLGDYSVTRSTSTVQAEESFQISKPDLIIADILLEGKSSLGWLKKHALDIPIIILTNNYSNEFYEDSLALNAQAYLMKPVNAVSLKFEIERIQKHQGKSIAEDESKIIIKDGQKIILITPSELIWVKTEGNYSTIKTTTKKIVIKKSLAKIVAYFDSNTLFRTHRSAMIQINKIDSIDLKKNVVLMMDGQSIPLSKKYRMELAETLGDIYTKLL